MLRIARILTPSLFLFLSTMPLYAETHEIGTPDNAERIGRQIRNRWREDRPIDEPLLRRDGVRRLDGRHLTLYTDLPGDGNIDALPAVFDQLVPLLCDYFGLNRTNYDDFRIESFLIDDFARFERSGAVRQVPKLRNGYALRRRIWMRNQASDYYRRHLLLHEGVHAFMGYAFGHWGPPWYREGTAELLATHRWDDGKLRIAVFPDSPKDFFLWGRIEYIRRDVERKRFRRLDDVFRLAAEDYGENESYAWSWAFAAFCENHSAYRSAFRQTAWKLTGKESETMERFLALVSNGTDETSVRDRLENDWLDFQRNIDYAYDFRRTAIDCHAASRSVPETGTVGLSVQSARGWQHSGFRLEGGQTYEITASGRFQLADNPRIWWSEPNGVTLRYHNGRPIGLLLGALIPEALIPEEKNTNTPNGASSGFLDPRPIGNRFVWTPERSGALFFRINDFVSELDDNRGAAEVEIRRIAPSREDRNKNKAP